VKKASWSRWEPFIVLPTKEGIGLDVWGQNIAEVTGVVDKKKFATVKRHMTKTQ
jgi:hypothetical protein